MIFAVLHQDQLLVYYFDLCLLPTWLGKQFKSLGATCGHNFHSAPNSTEDENDDDQQKGP
jgi:hypothetical protein